MSYITAYSLEFDDPDAVEEIAEALDRIGCGELAFGYHQADTWYEHEQDMLYISEVFPGTEFILTGVGEEFPDMWKKRFVNGQVDEVRATLTWPEFPPLT